MPSIAPFLSPDSGSPTSDPPPFDPSPALDPPSPNLPPWLQLHAPQPASPANLPVAPSGMASWSGLALEDYGDPDARPGAVEATAANPENVVQTTYESFGVMGVDFEPDAVARLDRPARPVETPMPPPSMERIPGLLSVDAEEGDPSPWRVVMASLAGEGPSGTGGPTGAHSPTSPAGPVGPVGAQGPPGDYNGPPERVRRSMESMRASLREADALRSRVSVVTATSDLTDENLRRSLVSGIMGPSGSDDAVGAMPWREGIRGGAASIRGISGDLRASVMSLPDMVALHSGAPRVTVTIEESPIAEAVLFVEVHWPAGKVSGRVSIDIFQVWTAWSARFLHWVWAPGRRNPLSDAGRPAAPRPEELDLLFPISWTFDPDLTESAPPPPAPPLELDLRGSDHSDF